MKNMAPRPPRQPWPPEHDALLCTHYPHRPTPEVAAMVGRSLTSTKARVDTLGLKKTPEYKRAIARSTTRARSPWGPELEEIMALLYPHAERGQLEALLGMPSSTVASKAQDMGLKKTPELLTRVSKERNAARRHKDEAAYLQTLFQPGQSPWNKGTKGLHKGGGATRFALGNTPPSLLPVDTVRMRTLSGVPNVLMQKIAHPNVWRPVHQLVWEITNGKPLPSQHIVRFVDGNRHNLQPANLYVISKADFARQVSPLCNGNLPPELGHLLRLRGALTRTINNASKKARTP